MQGSLSRSLVLRPKGVLLVIYGLERKTPQANIAYLLLLTVVVVVFGQCHQDHRELLPVDLAILIKVATTQYGFLKLVQVSGIIVLAMQY